MKRFFFFKLAFSNIKKNASLYVPYLLVSSFTAMMFYLITFLSSNEGLASMRAGARTMPVILQLGMYIVLIFSVIFIFYLNSFLMKRRQKEIALYNMLGMEKGHIMIMMFYEMIMTTTISVVAGIISGIIFSHLMALILLKLIGLSSSLSFGVSFLSIFIVCIVFIVINFFASVINMIKVKISNPIALLRQAQSGEKEPKASWIITIIGVVTLAAGYYIASTVNDLDTVFGLFFIAVILVIIGTYALFVSGSIKILKILKKNRRYYYQTKHFISISQLLYRMKQNAVGLASICILCTCVLVMISSTITLYLGIDQMVENNHPNSTMMTFYGDENMHQPSHESYEMFYQDIRDSFDEKDIPIEYMRHLRCYNVAARYSNGDFLYEESNSDFEGVDVDVMTADEFNRSYNTQYELKDNEVLLYTNFLKTDQTIRFQNQQYSIKKKIDQPAFLRSGKSLFIVMKDQQTVERLLSLFDDAGEAYEYLIIDYPKNNEKEAEGIISECLDRYLLTLNSMSYHRSSKYEARENYFDALGSLFFLGFFLGTLFLMAIILLMYYKQLSEGYEDQRRFQILQQVGLTNQEVKQTIRSQILIFFFLPLIVCIIHMMFAYHLIDFMILEMLRLNSSIFLQCMIISAGIISVLYFIVYLLTSKVYYHIVKEG